MNRDIIKLYLIDLFSKNYDFRKMTITDISRRFSYDMGMTLTTRIFRKIKKVTIEFLEEILETESEFESQINTTEKEPSLFKNSNKTKKSNVAGNITADESRLKLNQKVVPRMLIENEETNAYYSTLNVFKQTGISLPRTELTEAKTAAAKIAVLQTVMRNAGLQGEFTIENAELLKEKLATNI